MIDMRFREGRQGRLEWTWRLWVAAFEWGRIVRRYYLSCSDGHRPSRILRCSIYRSKIKEKTNKWFNRFVFFFQEFFHVRKLDLDL